MCICLVLTGLAGRHCATGRTVWPRTCPNINRSVGRAGWAGWAGWLPAQAHASFYCLSPSLPPERPPPYLSHKRRRPDQTEAVSQSVNRLLLKSYRPIGQVISRLASEAGQSVCCAVCFPPLSNLSAGFLRGVFFIVHGSCSLWTCSARLLC